MNKTERAKIEKKVWRNTHRDYRSEPGSLTHPSILVWDNKHGTCLKPLENLTEEELLERLP